MATKKQNSAVQIQPYLDLGPRSHIELLHRENTSGLALAINDGKWSEEILSKDEALVRAETIHLAEVDTYVSQNAFNAFLRRSVSSVSRLETCYVDVDIYNTRHKDLDAFEVLQNVIALNPDLPMPTIAGSSGRGLQFYWAFDDTTSPDYLASWQQIQHALVDVFKEYGADPHCKDASRMLRLSGTLNTKSDTYAKLQQLDEPVEYKKLLKFLNRWKKENKPASKPRSKQKGPSAKRKGTKARHEKDGFSLALGRMQDLYALAQLRGGKYEDYRKRALFYFACSAAWFCPSPEKLRAEVECFIRECFAEPDLYGPGMVDTVIQRKKDGADGATVDWDGKQIDNRYRYWSKTLIDNLDITEVEQRQLRVTINDKIKKERDTIRKRERRKQHEWAAHLAERKRLAHQRQRAALDLRGDGLTQRQIAEQLSLSLGSINHYLRDA